MVSLITEEWLKSTAYNFWVIHDERPPQISPIPPFISKTRAQSINVFTTFASIISALLRARRQLSGGSGRHGTTEPQISLQPIRFRRPEYSFSQFDFYSGNSPCSVYYDYTEEFETRFPDQVHFESTVSPQLVDVKNAINESAMREASIDIDIENKDEGANFSLRKSNEIKPALSISSVHRRLISEFNAVETVKENKLTASILAGHVSTVHSSDSSEDDWVWDGSEGDAVIEGGQIAHDGPSISLETAAPSLEGQQPQAKWNDAAIKRLPCLDDHHLDIDTKIAIQCDENKQATPGHKFQESNVDAEILSPSPISPAHQLRVSNSIPQLMKSLPPLPCEAQCEELNPFAIAPEDTEVHNNVLLSSSPADVLIAARPGGDTGEPPSEPAFSSNDLRTSPRQRIQSQPQMSQSRFKVRVKSSQSSGLSSKWTTDFPDVLERSSSSPVKPRLRLKVSRNRISSRLLSPYDINTHNEGIRQYVPLLVGENSPRREISSDRPNLGEALEEQLVHLNSDKRLSNIDEGITRGPQISDQFDISYPPSAKGIVMAELVPRSDLETEPDPFERQQRDFVNRSNLEPLKYRTSGPQPNGALKAKGKHARAISDAHESRPATLGSDITSDSSDESTLAPSQITLIISQRLRSRTRRVKRWVSELKRTVRKIMKRAPRRQ
ncbi:hypothetical protein FLONG3_10093 [Fusarium longipes]|uniref:Uncharacterized protein n=1 Tax=Fusarium longipes TaxID=694270 RepID=A0A395RRY3_9HYPO|nr:hypothetical protein FLONG3_10093 [Fusarium longipes]